MFSSGLNRPVSGLRCNGRRLFRFCCRPSGAFPCGVRMFCACSLLFGLTDQRESYFHGLALGHGSGNAMRQSRDILRQNGEILAILD